MGDDKSAAYGGPGWQPRSTAMRNEIGGIWGPCGAACGWWPLRTVLLHRPGAELAAIDDVDAMQMLEPIDAERAGLQHDGVAAAYRTAGVAVRLVEPARVPSANLMFVADLLFMTPEGAILARPASQVRAGEERDVARRLAALGVPILRSVRGAGTFEGADAEWLDPQTAIVGTGLRTNADGAAQVAATLRELAADVITTALPSGTMHLMGALRLLDERLALVWPGRIAEDAIAELEHRGWTVLRVPDLEEARRGMALNFVTLGPRRVLMATGNPKTQRFLEEQGVACVEVNVHELHKAAGGIGCLSGVLERAEPQSTM